MLRLFIIHISYRNRTEEGEVNKSSASWNRPWSAHPEGVCTHTGKTGVGSDSIAGCNVNKNGCFHTQPVRPSCRPGKFACRTGTRQAGRRTNIFFVWLISFNVLRCNLHTYLNLSVSDDCFKYLSLYETHRRQR